MPGRIVGLDIGLDTVKAVLLSSTFRGWELLAVGEERIEGGGEHEGLEATTAPVGPRDEAGEPSEPEGSTAAVPELLAISEAVSGAVGRLRARGLLDGDAVFTALPRDAVYLAQVALPFGAPARVADVLPLELDGKLPVEVEDLLLDFIVGPQGSAGFPVFVAGARPEHIAGMLGMLGEHGVEPRGLDLSPFPVVNAARAAGMIPGDGATAVLDIGARETGIVVVRGDAPEYARSVAGGGEAITEALAKTFGLDHATARAGKHREAFIDAGLPELEGPSGDDATDAANACREAIKPLVLRIRQSLLAHSREAAPVERVVLAGSTARIPGLAEYVSQSLGVPVLVLRVDVPQTATLSGFADESVRFAQALGLALQGVAGSSAVRFNFRRGPFAFTGSYEFLRQRAGALVLGVGAVAAAAAVLLAGQYALLRAERRALDGALNEVTRDVFGRGTADPRAVALELASAGGRLELHPERSSFDIFVDVANVIGDLQDQQREVKARSLDVDLSRFLFRLDGEASNAETVDELEQQLEDIDCLGTVTRNDLSAVPGGTGFRFGLQGAIDCDDEPAATAAATPSGSAGGPRR